jgi:hypothetical protein
MNLSQEPSAQENSGLWDPNSAGLNTSSFVNVAPSDLSRDTSSGSVDWEHVGRHPIGSSIIDASSVGDEPGRTFHGYREGKCFLPNDAAEQDRLDLQHAVFLHLFGQQLYRAPLQDPKFVIDIATGTGIWAMKFGMPHLLLFIH